MAGEVVVDALPYFDQGYDEPGVRDAVQRYSRKRKAPTPRTQPVSKRALFEASEALVMLQDVPPINGQRNETVTTDHNCSNIDENDVIPSVSALVEALALVEEETRRYRPTKNYLEYMPPAHYNLFETEIMKTEFERLQSRLPMDMMNMKRYELPQPPAGKMTDVSAWNECVENSQAQLEHQALRILNLELLQDYGGNAWKMYNDTLVKMMEQAQKQLAELKKKIQEINWQRKNEQSVAGGKLKDLENSWVGLVGKNYEIERACVEMEKELAELEKQKKTKR